jgi:hypothetical protein
MTRSAARFGLVAAIVALVTACTNAAPPAERPSLHDMWQSRLNALAQSDREALARVESGTALQVDTAYFLETCPELCDPPPSDPAVRSTEILAEDASRIVGIAVDSWYPRGAVGPTLISMTGHPAHMVYHSILTLEDADRISGEQWSTVAFDAADLDALAEYAEFRAEVANTGKLPAAHPFAPGRLTTGYLDSLSTHMQYGPEIVARTEVSLDEVATAKYGFVLLSVHGERLACGVMNDVSTLRSANGKAISRTLLGDQEFRAPVNSAPGFRVTTVMQSCVLRGQTSLVVPALSQATATVDVVDPLL